MKTYIVYDKRNGEILHKYRMTSLEQGESEDTLDCREKEVLASFRGSHVPKKYLAVDTLGKYQPRSSRDRVVKFNVATRRLVAKAPDPIPSRAGGSRRKPSATAQEEK